MYLLPPFSFESLLSINYNVFIIICVKVPNTYDIIYIVHKGIITLIWIKLQSNFKMSTNLIIVRKFRAVAALCKTSFQVVLIFCLYRMLSSKLGTREKGHFGVTSFVQKWVVSEVKCPTSIVVKLEDISLFFIYRIL